MSAETYRLIGQHRGPVWRSRLVVGLLLFLFGFAGALPELLSDPVAVRYEAENLGLPNWAGADYAPQISPDGRYLVFQSDRPGAREGQNLWFSTNLNVADRLGPPRWTVPLPLYLPMDAKASDTMKVVGGKHVLTQPPGTFSINTDGFEGMTSIVYQNERPVEVFFTSVRHSSTGRDGFAGLNIYHSRFTADRWTEPVHLNAVNSHFNDRSPLARLIRNPTTGATELELFFASDRPGGYGGSDLWRSVRESNGSWSRPRNLGPSVNTRYEEVAPGMNPAGGLLFFSSNRPGGFGHYDLYVSRRAARGWGEPKNLGRPFNSERDDECLSFTDDGLWAYYSSDRRSTEAVGRFDMYRTRVPSWLRDPVGVLFTGLILDGTTRLALGVEATIKVDYERKTLVDISRVISGPLTADSTNFGIRLSSGRMYRVTISAPGFHPHSLVLNYEGAIPTDRIDRRTIVLQPIGSTPPGKKEPGGRELQARIVDEQDNPIAGAEGILIVGEGRPVSYRADAKGGFVFEVPKGSKFTITGRASGFMDATRAFEESDELKEVVVRLKRAAKTSEPCRSNMQECLDQIRIYFATDSAALRPAQQRKLETVKRVLDLNPGVTVEISGYADRRASFEYNKELSLRRARAVQAALTTLGINPDRLKLTGKSFLQPVCRERTKRCMALNRRVEFKRLPAPGR